MNLTLAEVKFMASTSAQGLETFEAEADTREAEAEAEAVDHEVEAEVEANSHEAEATIFGLEARGRGRGLTSLSTSIRKMPFSLYNR